MTREEKANTETNKSDEITGKKVILERLLQSQNYLVLRKGRTQTWFGDVR